MAEKLYSPYDLNLPRADHGDSWQAWNAEAASRKASRAPQDLVKAALARAYISKDGFAAFCRDVVGGKDPPDPKFHVKGMFPYILGKTTGRPSERTRKFRMIQAFRGSRKTTYCSIHYPAWRIAREYVTTGASELTIGIACEKLALAKAIVRSVRGVLDSRPYRDLFGTHRPDRGSDSVWSTTEFFSRNRADPTNKDPTVMTMAAGADRTGYHFDLIIADDLQAETTSYSRDQLERSWDLYRLMHALLNPGGEILMPCTRWHYDDIYARIERQNEEEDPGDRFIITKLPAEDEDGRPTCPMILDARGIKQKRAKMQSVYAPQYLLDPVPDESRLLDKRWFKYRTPQIDRDLTAKKTYCVIGADPAWLAQSRYGSTRAGAYSVILVFLVDQGYDFYLIDHFREKCAKSRFVQRLFEMSKEHRAVKVGMEVVDLKYLDEAFDLEAHKTKYRPPMEWLSTISSMQKKDDKIIGTLEGFLSQGKIFLYRGMEWLEREAHDFPKSATKDGLDAMVNAVRVARPPKRILDRLGPITDCARDIDELHKRSAAPTDWRKSWAR